MKTTGHYARLLQKACPHWTLFCLLAAARSLHAQDVLAPRPDVNITPPAVQELQANPLDAFQPQATPETPSDQQPFTAGPITARPHMFYRFLYGDGILRRPGETLSTAIHEISPGLQIDIGRHWALDYTPTIRLYSNKSFSDGVDHSVRLTGGATYGDWTFGLSQAFASISSPLIETGTQTDQQTHTTALNASCAFSSQLSLDLAVNQNIVSSDQFASFNEWSTLNWLNFRLAPRLELGLGLGAGYANLDQGADMTYEQLQGRIRWLATQKISFLVGAGGEDRQFLSGGADDLINPVFSATIQYQPLETTRLSLTAGRVVNVSYLQSQVAENSEIRGDLNQRLLKNLNLNIGGAYHTVNYIASTTGGATGRKDDYYSLDARLSCSLLKRGTVAVVYQYLDNTSTQTGFSFSSNQIGFEVGYRF